MVARLRISSALLLHDLSFSDNLRACVGIVEDYGLYRVGCELRRSRKFSLFLESHYTLEI